MESKCTPDRLVYLISLILLSTISCRSSTHAQLDKALSDYLATRKYVNENYDSYKHIREMMRDSFMINTNRKQKYSIHPMDSFTIDSLLLFNKNGDRFVTTINLKKLSLKTSFIDVLIEAHGVRIGEEWYFDRSFDVPVTREHFSQYKYKPLSYDLLSFLNRTTNMNRYYNVNQDQNLIIDYMILDKRLSGRTLYGVKDYSDEEFIQKTKDRYNIKCSNKMDSIEIQAIYSTIDTTEIPNEPIITQERKERIDNYSRTLNTIGINVN